VAPWIRNHYRQNNNGGYGQRLQYARSPKATRSIGTHGRHDASGRESRQLDRCAQLLT
jgi:hypothetical protein